MSGIVVKPRSRIFHGHDWVYGSEVLKTFGKPEPGDVISLKDGQDRSLGSAIYNPNSQIIARRFSRRRQELDHDFFVRNARPRRERFAIAMEQPMVLYETLQTPYYTIPQLREITCPVLGFWGLHDQFLPYQQNEVLKEALPKSRIVLSDQSGHWVMIEDKHLFNRECLDFLENA